MMDNENSGKSGMDKVSVIGSIVCVGILGLIMYMNFTAPKPQPPVRPAVSAPLTSAPIESLPAVAAPIAEENAPVDTSWMADAPDLHLARQGEFDAKFCAIGGGIETVTLEQFTVQTNVEAEKSDLVVMGNGGQPFLRCDVEEGFYVQQAAPYQLENGTIVLEQLSADGALKAVQTWQPIQGSDYEMKYSLTVQNMSGTVQSVPRMMIGCGALPAFLSRQKQSYLSGNAGFVAYGIPGKDKAEILLEKKIKKLNDKPEKRQALAETPASWLAVSSKYFLFAMRHPKLVLQDAAGNSQVLAMNFAGVDATTPYFPAVEGHESQKAFYGRGWLPDFKLRPGEAACFTTDGYAGPKNYVRLHNMGEGIDSIMGMNLFFFWNFAWMGWISRGLLAALVWIAGIFGAKCGYGLGIIFVTFCVKLIFMPLSYRSTMSMRKMQIVQPQLKALRERFKDDPQRMYHEQQKLFKENNVSQMGGCLPMLLQIPVFFAMFNTFRSAIEIRNAEFLWIADMSMPDDIFGLPIRPLALLTGVTMLVQQKLTPSPDPNQAKMMTMMSLIFVIFFYNMPAALTLYMTVNQLFSIVQMLIFRRMERASH